MAIKSPPPSAIRIRRALWLFVAVACVMLPRVGATQTLTGALIGTVKDAQGGVLPGAGSVSPRRRSSAAPSSDHEPERSAAVPGARSRTLCGRHPSLQGFAPYREEDISIGAGATIERTAHPASRGRRGVDRRRRKPPRGSRRAIPALRHAVRSRGPQGHSDAAHEHVRLHQRRPWHLPHLAVPARTAHHHVSRSAPAPTRTSSSSMARTSTCPCNGIARSEPGVDFIQEIQVQSVGASAEFGNMQGAVINVITQAGRRPLAVRRVLLRANGRPDQPAGAGSRSEAA